MPFTLYAAKVSKPICRVPFEDTTSILPFCTEDTEKFADGINTNRVGRLSFVKYKTICYTYPIVPVAYVKNGDCGNAKIRDGGVVLSAAAVTPVMATDLIHKKLTINTGVAGCQHVPVEINAEGADAPAIPAVKNTETGAVYPATLRDGKLVFVADSLAADSHIPAEIVSVEREQAVSPRVVINKRADTDIIDVQIDGVLFTCYHYGPEWRKPFLWPIKSEGGVGITRDFPMEVESTPKLDRDHPHQKSRWTAYGINALICKKALMPATNAARMSPLVLAMPTGGSVPSIPGKPKMERLFLRRPGSTGSMPLRKRSACSMSVSV